MPPGEPLSPELVLVAPPEEARRARAGLPPEPHPDAARASDERSQQVSRAWERLAERRLEQPEQPWERVAVRAAEQVERARELIAVRASELAQENWSDGEAADSFDGVEAVVDEAPVETIEEPAAPDWDEFLVRMRSDPVEPVVADEPAAEPPALSRSPRRRVAVAVGIVLALAFLAGVAWARDWFHGSPRSARTSAATASAPRPPTKPTPAEANPTPNPKPTSRPARKKPAATSGAKPKREVSATPARPKRTRKSAPARARTAAFVPARIWSWPSVRGSSRYRVRFFRNGGKVLDTRTTKPRLVLPRDFKFRAGRYRWTVVPISAVGKALQPIVDSTFVVSKR